MARRRLILVRHAPAENRDPHRWPDDSDRPLRKEGREEFIVAARGLTRFLDPPIQIVASSQRRARETAEILRHALGQPGSPSVWRELEPDAPAAPVLTRVARTKGKGDLVIAGHEPQFSLLVGLAVVGESLPIVKVVKGGAIALEFTGAVRPGGGRLLWVLTRNQLGRVKGAAKAAPVVPPKPRGRVSRPRA